MSKRYGRNQKRRDRQRIAELEIEASKQKLLAFRMADIAASKEQAYIDLVREIEDVCPNSVLLAPKKKSSPDLPIDYRIGTTPPIPVGQPYSDCPTAMTTHYQVLKRVRVLAGHDDFRDSVHIIVETPKGGVGYYMSETSYRLSKAPARFMNIISDQVKAEVSKLFGGRS